MDNFEEIEEVNEVNESTSSSAGELLEILLNTREQGQMIERLIKNQINIKDEMISKLHKELDYYKQDSAERFADQLMKAVIKVRKDMGRLLNSDKWSQLSLEDMQREYTYIFEDLTDLLEQQNVDPYRTKPGEPFDPAVHQPKLETTATPELDKTVKESLSEGYKKGGKVLISERVLVYQYKEQAKENEQ